MRNPFASTPAAVSEGLEEVKCLARLARDVESTTEQLKLAKLETDSVARTTQAHRRLDAVIRKFDEAVDRLTDNREVIAGLKAAPRSRGEHGLEGTRA